MTTVVEDDGTLAALDAEIAKGELYEFVKMAWPILEPGRRMDDNWHIKLICEKLEAVTRGEIKRLIVNIPPRFMKSTIASVCWPIWSWLQNPNRQFLTVSHNATLATRDAVASRRIINSAWFQEHFGMEFQLAADQNQKTRYENSQRGHRIAVGVGGGATGENCDCVAGETLVATEWGDIPIAEIHAMAVKPRAWSVSKSGKVELKRIVASRVIRSRPTINITTLAGDNVRCTPDHKIWDGNGYTEAKHYTDVGLPVMRIANKHEKREANQVQGLQHSHIRVCNLQESIPEARRRTRQVDKTQPKRESGMLSQVLGSVATTNAIDLSTVRQKVHGHNTGKKILLNQMQRHLPQGEKDSEGSARQAMRNVRRDYGYPQSATEVLHDGLQKQSAQRADERQGQQPLQVDNGHERFIHQDAPIYIGARRPSLHSLQRKTREQEYSCSSHRLESRKQSPIEFDNTLQCMPFEPPQIEESTGRIDSRRIHEDGQRIIDVYDIQVEDNHNFFAGGILVHNCLIVDDLMDRKKAFSEAHRINALETYDTELETRLNDPNDSAIVGIQQRLVEKDWTGHVLATEPEEWEHICLPMEYDPDHPYVYKDDPRTKKGELLWPERFDAAYVERRRKKLGPYAYSGQYQQLPAPAEGGIIKRSMFYDCVVSAGTFTHSHNEQKQSVTEQIDVIFCVVDTAYSTSKTADYTVQGAFGGNLTTHNMCVMNWDRSKIDLRENQAHETKIEGFRARNGASVIYIEAKSFALGIIKNMKAKHIPVRPVKADVDKVARAHGATPYLETSGLGLPEHAEWLTDFLAEVLSFPVAEHDDQVDCMVHAVLVWLTEYIHGATFEELDMGGMY